MLLHRERTIESPPEGPRQCGALEGLMLDIGDGVGALIVFADEGSLGREIEISPADASEPEDPRIHADVHERRLGGRPVYAAVFVSLPQGDYVVWAEGDRPAREVTVRSASVSETTLTGPTLIVSRFRSRQPGTRLGRAKEDWSKIP